MTGVAEITGKSASGQTGTGRRFHGDDMKLPPPRSFCPIDGAFNPPLESLRQRPLCRAPANGGSLKEVPSAYSSASRVLFFELAAGNAGHPFQNYEINLSDIYQNNK